MQDMIKEFLDYSRAINSDIFTLTRLELLILLLYSIEGAQYRELKAALDISDGNIKTNLSKLESLNYIQKADIEMDNKKLSTYVLTEQGQNEVKKILHWMKITIDLGEAACLKI